MESEHPDRFDGVNQCVELLATRQTDLRSCVTIPKARVCDRCNPIEGELNAPISPFPRGRASSQRVMGPWMSSSGCALTGCTDYTSHATTRWNRATVRPSK